MGVVLKNEIAVREQQGTTLSNDQLKYIAGTEFVPQGLRNNIPAIMACVATGRAIGIDDMSSLRLIHVVNGRPTFSAELMVQIVRRHGHSLSGSTKDGSCTVIGKRADNGDTMEVTWTLEMAQRAGLANKAVWKAYPEALLWARAVSQLCRMLFADCFAGATYTPDEVADGEYQEIEDSAGEPQAEVTPDPVSTVSEATAPTVEQPSLADTPSEPMLKKLNVLVGTLREQGHITTEDVYTAVGRDPEVSEDGELHWSPLRDSLTRQEASDLIELLSKVETDVNGLSAAAFRANVKDHGISPEAGAAAMHRLFPGVEKSSDLSDVQRAQVWKELRPA